MKIRLAQDSDSPRITLVIDIRKEPVPAPLTPPPTLQRDG